MLLVSTVKIQLSVQIINLVVVVLSDLGEHGYQDSGRTMKYNLQTHYTNLQRAVS